MVDKNIRLKTKNKTGGFDNLYPQTKSDLVLVNEKNLSTVLEEITAQLTKTQKDFSTLDSRLQEIEAEDLEA